MYPGSRAFEMERFVRVKTFTHFLLESRSTLWKLLKLPPQPSGVQICEVLPMVLAKSVHLAASPKSEQLMGKIL